MSIFHSLHIEILKSKRTKSFFIVFFLMIIATVWNLACTVSEINKHSELWIPGSLFNNQTVDVLLLPMAISVFVSKLWDIERSGSTFKLLHSNGQSLSSIIFAKMELGIGFLSLLSLFENLIILVFGYFNHISISTFAFFVAVIGKIFNIVLLFMIYQSIAVLFNSRGVLLTLGIIGGFIGISLSAKSSMLFSFLIPWIGAAALSPYKFSLLSSESNNISYTYIADDLILMKLSLYFVYIILMLLISRRIFKRKDGEQPCL